MQTARNAVILMLNKLGLYLVKKKFNKKLIHLVKADFLRDLVKISIIILNKKNFHLTNKLDMLVIELCF